MGAMYNLGVSGAQIRKLNAFFCENLCGISENIVYLTPCTFSSVLAQARKTNRLRDNENSLPPDGNKSLKTGKKKDVQNLMELFF